MGTYYLHYKGGIYELLQKDGKHSETAEEMCVYRSMETKKVWIRPFHNFFELIHVPGTVEGLLSPRFALMTGSTGYYCPRCRAEDLVSVNNTFVCQTCDSVFKIFL